MSGKALSPAWTCLPGEGKEWWLLNKRQQSVSELWRCLVRPIFDNSNNKKNENEKEHISKNDYLRICEEIKKKKIVLHCQLFFGENPSK